MEQADGGSKWRNKKIFIDKVADNSAHGWKVILQWVRCIYLGCKMEHVGASHVKRACLLSLNQIFEIVTDSDSDEVEYGGWRSGSTLTITKVSQLTASIHPSFFCQHLWRRGCCLECGRSAASTHIVDTALLPPKACGAHLYWGPQREEQWSSTYHQRVHSTQRSAAVRHVNYFSAGCWWWWPIAITRSTCTCVRTDILLNLTWLKGNVCIFGCDITDGTFSSMRTGGLLDEIGAALLSILRTNDGTLEDIITYFGFCISQTIEGTDLTGRVTVMTDYEKCKTYLKFKG